LEAKFIVGSGGGGHRGAGYDLFGDDPSIANFTASVLKFLLLVK
jgi:hypothetical protein